MKLKKFTLIELLAVMLIFGILASIGLSIKSPSPVKGDVSKLLGQLQKFRADCIQKRKDALVRVYLDTGVIQGWYIDPFGSGAVWTRIDDRTPDRSLQLESTITAYTSKKVPTQKPAWMTENMVELWISKQGRFANGVMNNNSELIANSSGTPPSHWARSFKLTDPNNDKNTFLIEFSMLGSYQIHEGQSEITSAGFLL